MVRIPGREALVRKHGLLNFHRTQPAFLSGCVVYLRRLESFDTVLLVLELDSGEANTFLNKKYSGKYVIPEIQNTSIK